jgi:hypothetical protein
MNDSYRKPTKILQPINNDSGSNHTSDEDGFLGDDDERVREDSPPESLTRTLTISPEEEKPQVNDVKIPVVEKKIDDLAMKVKELAKAVEMLGVEKKLEAMAKNVSTTAIVALVSFVAGGGAMYLLLH